MREPKKIREVVERRTKIAKKMVVTITFLFVQPSSTHPIYQKTISKKLDIKRRMALSRVISWANEEGLNSGSMGVSLELVEEVVSV
jgi:hypothetical protein